MPATKLAIVMLRASLLAAVIRRLLAFVLAPTYLDMSVRRTRTDRACTLPIVVIESSHTNALVDAQVARPAGMQVNGVDLHAKVGKVKDVWVCVSSALLHSPTAYHSPRLLHWEATPKHLVLASLGNARRTFRWSFRA